METAFTQETSAERYQLALEASGVAIWDNDLLTDNIYFAGNGHELFIFSKDEHINLEKLLSRIHPADRGRTSAKVSESLNPQKRALYENEYRIIDPQDGQTVRWLRAKGKAYFTDIGTPYRFTGTVQDITKEVKARETQQKLLTLVDNSIELMSVLENDQKNSYINKAGMEMLGFESMEQVYETSISALHAPEDIAFVEANVLPAVINQGKSSGIMNVRHLRTGEIFPVLNNTIRIDDPVTGDPIAVGAVMRDMRPEMAAQKALAESEKNFRTLVMQAPVGICILKGPDFIVEIANDTFLEVARKNREELMGNRVIDIFPEVVRQGFDHMLKGVYTTGMPYYGKEFEVLQERNGSSQTIYVDFTFQPLLEPDGSVIRIINLSIDVTDKVLARKRLQESEEDLQKRVERTAELEKKNRELEEFTYVSSHDLQEPIRKIKLFREMIKERDYHNMSAYSQERFDRIGESVDRMSQSLKDLLHFASLDKKESQELVDLNVVMDVVKTDLELVIEQKNARISTNVLPVLKAVPHQMHQLLYNLVNNALKFAKQNKHPKISLTAKIFDPATVVLPFQPRANQQYWHLTCSDNGIGFEQEKAEKIFGMFQRLHTRQEYNGTGIGLALCKKVVSNHEGYIWAVSEIGKGATFHVLLPVA